MCSPREVENMKVKLVDIDKDDLLDILHQLDSHKATCLVDAIIDGREDERLRNFLVNFLGQVRLMASQGIESYVLLFDSAQTSPFLLKVSQSPEEWDSARHEFMVAVKGLNRLRSVIPTFMYIYAMFTCARPVVFKQDDVNYGILCPRGGEPATHILLENINNATSWHDFKEKCTLEEFINILVQIINGLRLAQEEFSFVHGDLHNNNVLVQTLDRPISIPLMTGKFINTNIVAKIIDFGASSIAGVKTKTTVERREDDIRYILYASQPKDEKHPFTQFYKEDAHGDQWERWREGQNLDEMVVELLEKFPIPLSSKRIRTSFLSKFVTLRQPQTMFQVYMWKKARRSISRYNVTQIFTRENEERIETLNRMMDAGSSVFHVRSPKGDTKTIDRFRELFYQAIGVRDYIVSYIVWLEMCRDVTRLKDIDRGVDLLHVNLDMLTKAIRKLEKGLRESLRLYGNTIAYDFERIDG